MSAPAGPSLASLPKAPPPPALTHPPATVSGADPVVSEAQTKLDSLVAALKSSQSALPPDIVQLLGTQALKDANAESKALHKAISAQTAAKKELHRVRQARRTFLESWSQHTTQLLSTVEKQLVEHQATLEKLAETEHKWVEQLREATTTLTKLPSAPHVVDSDSDLDSSATGGKAMEVADPWLSDDYLEKNKAQQQSLLRVLQEAKKGADEASASCKREGSRTPRRSGKESTEDNKDDAARPVLPPPA